MKWGVISLGMIRTVRIEMVTKEELKVRSGDIELSNQTTDRPSKIVLSDLNVNNNEYTIKNRAAFALLVLYNTFRRDVAKSQTRQEGFTDPFIPKK